MALDPDPKLQQPRALIVAVGWIGGTWAVLCLALVVISAVWPRWSFEVAHIDLLQLLSPSVWTGAAEANYSILTDVSNVSYAKSFYFIHVLSSAFLLPIAAIICTTHVRMGKFLKSAKDTLLDGVKLLVGGGFFVWWIVFSHDFYFASDHDYTGVLRPPFGSVVLAVGAWCSPAVVGVGLGMVAQVVFKRVKQGRAAT